MEYHVLRFLPHSSEVYAALDMSGDINAQLRGLPTANRRVWQLMRTKYTTQRPTTLNE